MTKHRASRLGFALLLLLALDSALSYAQAPEAAVPDTAAALAPSPAVASDTTSAADPAGSDSTALVNAPSPGLANARPMIGKKRIKLIGSRDNVARSGPGAEYAIVGVYPKGEMFPVVAKSGDWYGAKLSDTETGWIHASLCEELDDLSGLEFKPNPKLFTRTGSFLASGYTGAYAYDRKSNSMVLGGRLGYYVFDRILTEAGVSWTHVTRPREIVESLFGLSLEAESFDMLFYHINLAWEILPGRQMVPYLGGGVGSAIMLGRSEASVNYGAGTRLFLTKRAAMRWEVRNYRFRAESGTGRLHNNNIEFTLGTEYLF